MALSVTAQDGSVSLGDLARQSRADRESRQKQGMGTSEETKQLTEQLEQEQEDDAPIGFKSYREGTYRLWVPAPFELEDRDEAGTLLKVSSLSGVKVLVFAGHPVSLQDITQQATYGQMQEWISRLYDASQRQGCSKSAPVGSHKTVRCMVNGKLFGGEVRGSAQYLFTSSTVFPILCLTPITVEVITPQMTYAEKKDAALRASQTFQDMRNGGDACETVFTSVRLKEDEVATSTAAAAKAHRAVPAAPAAPPANLGSGEQQGQSEPSLAQVAQQSKEEAPQKAKAKRAVEDVGEINAAPAGYKSFSFSYSTENDIWDAYLLIPENAQLLDNYSGKVAFEAHLDTDRVYLVVGALTSWECCRLSTDPNVVRWDEFSQSLTGYNPKKPADFSSMPTKVDGKDGVRDHFRLAMAGSDQKWIVERVRLTSHEVGFIVGCMVPESRSADAQDLCTTFIDSLRLP